LKILFFTHYFPPEVNAPANRTLEHCREWVKSGHELHVITGVPSHPRGEPFPGYRRGWYRHEQIDGIHVHRVWTYLAANEGKIKRIANYLSFMPTSVLRALLLGDFDVIVATSPQFFCAVSGWASAHLKSTPWVFELRDLWPDSIAAVGALRSRLALKLLERLELHLYRDADAVASLTHSFSKNLIGRGIERAKLTYLPNGVVPEFWQSEDGGAVRAKLGVGQDSILATYVGTVGMAHGIGTVLEAARVLRTRAPGIHLAVIGDGAERAGIEARAREEGLDNLRFTGLVPHEEIPAYLAATDISMVLLKKSDLFLTVLPSKMFESMAAARPIVLGVGGEAKEVLARSGGGVAIPPEDATALAEAIVSLADDPEKRLEMGECGAGFVEREFNRKRWAARYLELLEGIAASPAASTSRCRG